MSEITVSIIIVNYNTSEMIVDCVNSIYFHTQFINFEIFVVDNKSSLRNINVLKNELGSKIKLIELSENIGFGRANNEAIRVAKGEFIFFLNPDTILQNNAISILIDFMRLHPKCGACGGNLVSGDLRPTHSYGVRFPGMIEDFDQAIKRKISYFTTHRNVMFNYSGKPRKVAFITGADLLVKKNILDFIGGFNPSFFMYYEDTELQFRIHRAGFEIWSVPAAKIIHLEGKSHKISRDREKRILESRKNYFILTHNKIWGIVMDKYYYFLTHIGYIASVIFGMQTMQAKLRQRLDLLKEIENEEINN